MTGPIAGVFAWPGFSLDSLSLFPFAFLSGGVPGLACYAAVTATTESAALQARAEGCGSARANRLDLQQIATVGETAMPQFTIAEAARAVGVDRATLYRYIKSGKLSLTRDEKGKRVVDAAELTRVFPAVSQNVAPATAERVDLLQEKLKAAEEKCVLLQQQLSAATAREEWMQQQIVGLQQRLLPSPRQGIIEQIAEAIARLRRPKRSL